jgi:uncharacterized protein (DUF362 family)
MGSGSSRRDFLKQAAVAAAGLGLAGRLGTGSAAGAAQASLVKIQGAGVPKDIPGALKKILEPLGGMAAFVKKGARVVLRPNMGFATEPQIRATTSPALVAAVAREVLACEPARVLVLDVPMRNPEACLRRNGIQAACKDLDVNVVLPTSERFFRQVPVPRGEQLKQVQVLADVLDCDVLIPLPVAKSHMAAGYSGGVKGHMGMILDRESFHSRYELNQAVADLATLFRVPLTILDGLEVMAQGGPAGPGELITANALVAGTDIVAVDALGVGLAPLYRRNIKGKQIRHLKKAAAMGVGKLDVGAGQFVELAG